MYKSLSIVRAALAAVILVLVSVNAQTSLTQVDISITPSPTLPSPTTSSPTPGTMTLECWRVTTIRGAPASLPVLPSDAAVSGALCWEVYPVGGGTASVPVSVTAPDFEPTSVQSTTSSTPAAANDISSNSSSHRAVKVIMPALIGSLVGIVLLVLATLYFLRLRMRRKNQQASRARRWVERNSGSWAMKEVGPASQKKAEGETVSPYPFAAGV